MALTFPSSPVDGQLYVDTVTGNRYIYDSGKGLWKYASNNVGMTVGTAPPPSASVAPGAMWYNTNTGRTFILYDDGDSRQWVENVPAVGSFDSSTVAGYANAAVLPAVTPAYNTANAGYVVANSVYALSNTQFVNNTSLLARTGSFSGTVTIGNSAPIGNATANSLSVSCTNNSSAIAAQSGGANTVFAILPWQNGRTYISSGIHYNNNAWIHKSDNAYNCIFSMSGDGGANWYASNNSMDSWNVSPGNPLWDATGKVAKAALPSGSVLQVVHTQLGSTFSGTSTQTGTGYYIDVTGLSATITPISSSSKIMILTNMYIGMTTAASGYQQHFRIKRNGTRIILGTSEGGRPTSTGRINMYGINTYAMQHFGGVHYDSPASTSALTYQIELGGYSGSPVVYVNRSETFQVGANEYDSIPVSTLTLMEIAQ